MFAISGSDDINEYVKSLGADACINYKATQDVSAAIQRAAPNGIDIYWDNVGADLLDLVINKLSKFGRAILCGVVSQYSADGGKVYGLKNTHSLITSSASLIGFLFSDCLDTYLTLYWLHRKVSLLVKEGKIQCKADIVDGLNQAPRAFIDLFKSANFGKRNLQTGLLTISEQADV